MAINYMEFIGDKVVVIPVIQRDYVQGADRNREKREEFLTVLLGALKSDRGSVNLDFIYGISPDKTSQPQSTSGEFLPVDGQQRLTTLYLLAWLLAQRGFEPEKRPELPRLDYRTSPATQQFVAELRKYGLPVGFKFEGAKTLSEHLMTEPDWFGDDWKTDPSVMAMLQMLDAMNRRLNEEGVSDIQKMAQRFFADNPFRLEVLDMEAFDLNEDLYIKMNARGKPLTKFENWKAEFGKFLKKHYPPLSPESAYGATTIPEHFDHAIEHDWCDLFWSWALKSWEDANQQEGATFPCIDEFFMSFFERLTELLFYAQCDVEYEVKKYQTGPGAASGGKLTSAQLFSGPNNEWRHEKTLTVYEKKENVLFLFRVLDLFSELESKEGGIQAFFEGLLCNGPAPDAPDKVNISYGSETKEASVNLFGAIIAPGKGPARNELLLFYGICKRLLKYKLPEGYSGLSDFIRVFWGWILGMRQWSHNELTISNDLREEDLWYADQICDALLGDADVFVVLGTVPQVLSQMDKVRKPIRDSVAREIKKAEWRQQGKYDAIKRLSQFPELRGDLHHLYPALDELSVDECVKRFRAFCGKSSDERVRLLCEHGFDGIETWGKRFRYYGHDNHWQLIFAADDCAVTNAVTSLLLGASPNPGPKDKMRWYMIHHTSFRTASDKRFFYVEAPFTVWTLRDGKGHRRGYLRCPYAHTVKQELKEPARTTLEVEDWSEGREHGRIWLQAVGYTLECVADGWNIECVDQEKAQAVPLRVRLALSGGGSASLQNAYTIKGSVLQDLPDKDRIKTAVDFLEDIARLYTVMTSSALRLPPAVSLPKLPPALSPAFPMLS